MSEVTINHAGSGDNTLVAAAPGYKYQVRKLFLGVNAVVSIKFMSGANNLTGLMAMASGEKFSLEQAHQTSAPWLTTNNNEALILNLSGAVQVSGRLIYDKVETA